MEWREPTMINVNWWVEFVDSPAVREHRALLKLSPSNVSSAKGQLSSVQINRAAGFITGLLDFKDLLETEQLPPEYMGKKRIPLCMNQYRMQFGVTRVPDKPGDRILHQFPATGRHIIVMIEDQIYSVPVLTEDGRRAPIEEIEA